MELQAPTTKNPQNPLSDSNNVESFTSAIDYLDSSSSTPFVSAPSSPGRAGGAFFYSAPASPMHFAIHSITSRQSSSESNTSFDFEFSARFGSSGTGPTGSMSSADELFLNGQIRPLDLVSDEAERGRDSRFRDRSLRRRAKSTSPTHHAPSPMSHAPPFRFAGDEEPREDKNGSDENASASSSRSSSAGRSSRRWVFLKEFLRSKSEGRSNNKFWDTGKDKKPTPAPAPEQTQKRKKAVGKRRVGVSAHEVHYTARRAEAEEMRKRTYLPYRQGLFGCLGFSSKGYGAVNGFARALNPVSSR